MLETPGQSLEFCSTLLLSLLAGYMLALLPPQDLSCLLTPSALLTGIILVVITAQLAEDWPLNAMVVFPYNAAPRFCHILPEIKDGT